MTNNLYAQNHHELSSKLLNDCKKRKADIHQLYIKGHMSDEIYTAVAQYINSHIIMHRYREDHWRRENRTLRANVNYLVKHIHNQRLTDQSAGQGPAQLPVEEV